MRVAPLLVGVLLPLPMVWAAARLLDAASATTELSSAAKFLDRRLAQGPPPQVIVLGNSKVGTDLDPATLARAFGVPRDAVFPAGLPGTGASAWYAELRLRVYDHGYTPAWVVVYATPYRIQQVAPEGTKETHHLEQQLAGGPPDEVAALRARFGGGRFRALRSAAGELRDDALDGVRNVAVGLLFDPGPDLAARGEAVATPALTTVFPVGVGTTRARAVPIAADTLETTSPIVPPDQSLAPELARLVAEHHGQAVFINAPAGPAFYGAEVASVAADEPAMRAAVTAAGGVWVDLPGDVMPASAYVDGLHMRPSGRRAFQDVLHDALVAAGAPFGLHSTAAPEAPEPPPMTRSGTAAVPKLVAHAVREAPCLAAFTLGPWSDLAPEALDAAGVLDRSPLVATLDGTDAPLYSKLADLETGGCAPGAAFRGPLHFVRTEHPEAAKLRFRDDLPLVDSVGRATWWAWPGTTLEVQVTQVAPVRLRARAAGPDAPVVVRRGDAQVALTRVGGDLRGELPAASGPLRLEVPADGPAVLLDRIVAVGPDGDTAVFGRPTARRSHSFLGDVDGAGPAPTPAAPDRPVETNRAGGTFFVRTDGAPVPGEADVESAAGIRCSPLRLDGLDAADWRTTSVPGRIVVTALRAGLTPPPTVALRLDDDRRCRGANGVWVYAGDRLRVSPVSKRPAAFPAPLDTLELVGHAFGDVGTLRWRVLVGDAEAAAGETSGPWTDAVRVALPAPVLLPQKDAQVELQLDRGALLLLAVDATEPAP